MRYLQPFHGSVHELESEEVPVSSNTKYVLIIKACGEISDVTMVIVMDTEGPEVAEVFEFTVLLQGMDS